MTGQSNEPMTPDRGVNAPTTISADGDICDVVSPKRMAAEVIVVKRIEIIG
jgi:hypothetical protein